MRVAGERRNAGVYAVISNKLTWIMVVGVVSRIGNAQFLEDEMAVRDG